MPTNSNIPVMRCVIDAIAANGNLNSVNERLIGRSVFIP